MARRPKLSRELIKEIAGHVEMGLSFKVSAILSGTSESTFHEWRAKARRGQRGLYTEFSEQIELASEKAKSKTMAAILEIGAGGRKIVEITERRDAEGKLLGTVETTRELPPSLNALTWLLERRWPEEFAPRSALEVTNGVNPFKINLFQQCCLPGSTDMPEIATGADGEE